MNTLFRFCALLALPLLPFNHAEAAYDPKIVAADARWVVHADFNALRDSALGREAITAIEKAQTAATGGAISIDVPRLLATIGTITAYGTNLDKDPNKVDGALIAQGTADLRKIAESLLLQGTLAEPEVFGEVKDLGYPAYSITEKRRPANANTNANAADGSAKTAPAPAPAANTPLQQVIIAFPPEPIIIVSKSKAQVTKARDVFRGSAPSMAKAGAASPLTKLAQGASAAYLFAASTVPAEPIFPENAPQARILQLANSGALSFGERGENTFAHADLLATSDQAAEKLMKILQGMTAMLSLAESNDRQLAEFLNSAAVNREGQTVTLHVAYSTARLIQMLNTLKAQSEPRPTPEQQQQSIIYGKPVAEWTAEEVPAAEGADNNTIAWRTVENVKLVNGGFITVGRSLNGGKFARFDRIEVIPAGSSTAAMVFRGETLRQFNRGMWRAAFPGADGTYTVKVAYVNDPDGKAKFAVSVRDPRPPQKAPEAKAGEKAGEKSGAPKSK